MAFSNQDIIGVLEEVVSSLRVTATYVGVYSNNVTTCTVDNELENSDIISINDVDYKVSNVTDTSFKVSGDVSSFTEYTTKAPYFMYGHMLEISNRLTNIGQSVGTAKLQKYPLIALKLDCPAIYSGQLYSFDYNDITLYICNTTTGNLEASQRRANNFEKVLIPIYESLINELKKNPNILQSQNVDNFRHEKIDRYFWGSDLNQYNNANPTNDLLDAIEIKGLQLSIKQIKCNL